MASEDLVRVLLSLQGSMNQSMGSNVAWLGMFKISSFLFHSRNKCIQVWNYIRVSK